MTTHTLINLDYLKTMAGGDPEMEQTLLDMVLAELNEEWEAMCRHFEEKNWKELFQASHKMKSTLAFVGNDELTYLNKAVEDRTRHLRDLHEVGTYMQQLEACLPPVIEALRAVRAQG